MAIEMLYCIKNAAVLFAQIGYAPNPDNDIKAHAREPLMRIADKCHWTTGRWEDLDREWNDIQNTNKDVRMLVRVA